MPASWKGSAGAAAFSACGHYRWWLLRPCQAAGSAVLFLGLNPSRADGERDDPTLRRLRALAGRWGHGRLLVMNLFARVGPDPALLRRALEPVGAHNDAWLATGLAWLAAQPPAPCGPPPRIWLGWGQQGGLHGRGEQVLDGLRCWNGEVVCVGLTRQGHPRHPLFCRADQLPQPFVVAPPMSRILRCYAIHLLLSSGHEEVVQFPTLDAFQQWYTSALHGGASPDTFINVPISELDGEYLLVRAGNIIGLRVEPLYGSIDN